MELQSRTFRHNLWRNTDVHDKQQISRGCLDTEPWAWIYCRPTLSKQIYRGVTVPIMGPLRV